MLLSEFKEDTNKQESGSPCWIGEGCFYVKRLGTTQARKEIEELKMQLYGFAPKDVDHDLVMAHWLAEHGVTNWEGIHDGSLDNPVKYSKQNARAIFLDKEYFQSLNAILLNHAALYSNYIYDETEKDIEAVKKK